MKRFLLFLVMITCIQLYGQQSFVKTFGTDCEEIPLCMKQIGSNYFISGSFSFNKLGRVYQAQIIKLNARGEIVSDKLFPFQAEGFTGLTAIFPLNESEFLMVGGTKSDLEPNAQVWIMKMDTSLNIIWDQKYMTNKSYISNAYLAENAQGNILIGTSLAGDGPYGSNSLFFIEITKQGDSLRSQYVEMGNPQNMQIGSLLYIDEQYKAFVGGFGEYVNYSSFSQILQLDTTLNICEIRPIPDSHDFYMFAENINNSYYYITSMVYNPSNIFDVSITKFDINENVLADNHAGSVGDIPDYSAFIRCMAISNSNSIYTGGSARDNGNFYSCTENLWKVLMLSNYDSLLNCRWTYFYGSDTACYTMSTMDATSDGGCIIAGMFYTPERPEKMLDVVVIKVDSMGLITGPDKIKDLVKNAVLFPNPGSDYLMVQSGPQIAGAKFTLYNTPGYAVLTTKLESTYQQIDTRSLTSGLYLWQIVYRDKIVDQGKWIKQ